MKNKIEDLRNHLFAQLERLTEPDCDIEKEKDRSMQIIDVAEAVIGVGKLEIEFIKAADHVPISTINFFENNQKQIAKSRVDTKMDYIRTEPSDTLPFEIEEEEYKKMTPYQQGFYEKVTLKK